MRLRPKASMSLAKVNIVGSGCCLIVQLHNSLTYAYIVVRRLIVK